MQRIVRHDNACFVMPLCEVTAGCSGAEVSARATGGVGVTDAVKAVTVKATEATTTRTTGAVATAVSVPTTAVLTPHRPNNRNNSKSRCLPPQ